MSFLYICEKETELGVNGGCFVIHYPDQEEETVPKNTVEGIAIFGRCQVTTACIQFCLDNGIPISFFSAQGYYHGVLQSIENVNVKRQRLQCKLTENEEFSLQIAKRLIHAKINNQIVVAKRYIRNTEYSSKELLYHLRESRRKVLNAEQYYQVIGYEGIASRYYFEALARVIDKDFGFKKRSRNPAKDPFNSMLNYGYAILSKEIHGFVINRGLNPYFGFLHRDKEKHATLVSDLIEEWRPVIVDSAVLGLIQGHEISKDMFSYENESCLLKKQAKELLIQKIESKMYTENKYLTYLEKDVSFRKAIWHQVDRIAKVIDNSDPEMYMPVEIR